MTDLLFPLRPLLLALALAGAAPALQAQGRPSRGDFIVAVVNQELVTASELETRLARIQQEAARNKATLPPAETLRRQVLDTLIDERVQLTHARENGPRVEESDVDRAVVNVAVQNQLTPAQLRERLRRDGVDYGRFRSNVRDQLITERVREREVIGRIRVSDAEVDAYLDKRRAESGAAAEYNVAQILVTVREGADVAEVAQRRARADSAMARVRGGEAFEAVARELSEDPNRQQGGVLGLRTADRLPDVFVETVRGLKVGETAPALLRTGAGFHLLKLVEKREADAFRVPQTRVRHILLRISPQLAQEAAQRRLAEMKRRIETGAASFEQLAREFSDDGSAAQGGDLGWAAPGTFVPEFEQAMNGLAINGLSEPVVSRFGVHLLQVLDRRQVTMDLKQQREMARNALREQKFDDAYAEWLAELRARAYVEIREAP